MTVIEFWKGGEMLYKFNLELIDDVHDLARYLTSDDDELTVRIVNDVGRSI
jgi:hypothetical protein